MPSWKGQAKRFGNVPSKSLVKAAEDETAPKKRRIESYRTKEQADICITCQKEKCKGGDICFRNRKKELECADSGG